MLWTSGTSGESSRMSRLPFSLERRDAVGLKMGVPVSAVYAAPPAAGRRSLSLGSGSGAGLTRISANLSAVIRTPRSTDGDWMIASRPSCSTAC